MSRSRDKKRLYERSCHNQYTYEISNFLSLVSYGFLVMSKVKVFANASDIAADGRTMTLAPQTFVPAR